jgi:hypothetical protein
MEMGLDGVVIFLIAEIIFMLLIELFLKVFLLK